MKKITLLCTCIIFLFGVAFSEEIPTQNQVYGQDLIQGLEAYRVGDWENSLFFLKRTSNFQDATSDSVWFFVIMAEMNIADYSGALRDGTTFLEIFPDSTYTPEITYQTLYAGYELGMYDETILGFTDFVHTYPKHTLTPSAIFLTGEALYNIYDFMNAKLYFNTIVTEYPTSEIYDDAIFRLELLEQREREEKLLYLLRVTGEEAVAAKEDYERQIKQLQSEESIILRKRLQELEQEHNKLQIEKQELVLQNENLKNSVQELNAIIDQNAQDIEGDISVSVDVNSEPSEDNNDFLIDELTKKALELQQLINKN